MNSALKKLEFQATESDTISAFSNRIFGFDWSNHFPLSLDKDEQVVLVNYAKASMFLAQYHEKIFQLDCWGNSFYDEGQVPSKRRYYEEVADCFLFTRGQKPFGLIIGTVIDGTSYYLRYGAILPEFQNGGRVQTFVNHIVKLLEDNSVVRVETDISPSNLANIHLFNKLQFKITGVTNSERWGSLVHMTKIMNSKAEKIFLDQFCVGTRPQLRDSLAEVIDFKQQTKRRGT